MLVVPEAAIVAMLVVVAFYSLLTVEAGAVGVVPLVDTDCPAFVASTGLTCVTVVTGAELEVFIIALSFVDLLLANAFLTSTAADDVNVAAVLVWVGCI